jgi:hypothetical protein
MIYFDTLSGKLIIDTEKEPLKETIVISRNASGTHIEHRRKKEKIEEGNTRRFFSAFKPRSFLGILFQW